VRVGAEDEGAEAARTVGLPALVREIQRIDTIRLYAGQHLFLLLMWTFTWWHGQIHCDWS